MYNYSRKELEEIISGEVLVPSEVAALLGVSKASVSNMIARGTLVPIKTSMGSSLFLRSEIEDYKNKRAHKNVLVPATIIGGGVSACDRYVQENYTSEVVDKAIGIFIYFFDEDAIEDRFYSPSQVPKQNRLTAVDVPHLVVRFSDSREDYFASYNCGYGGTGPSHTYRLLTDVFGVAPDIANAVYHSRILKLYKEDEWKIAMQVDRDYGDIQSIQEEHQFFASRYYMYNGNLVVCKSRVGDMWMRHKISEQTKLEDCLYDYFGFLRNPSSICLYSREKAIETGHYDASFTGSVIAYQIIVKDDSGREVWLDYEIDEDMPLAKQSTLMSLMHSLDIRLESDDIANYPPFIKTLLTKNIKLETYLELRK